MNVFVLVKGREVTYWVEDPKGNVLPDRKVRIHLSSGTKSGDEPAKGGKRKFTVQASAPVDVTVSDEKTGTAAFTAVRP